MFNHWLLQLENLIFPTLCVFCGDESKQVIAVCRGCEDDLPWQNNSCIRCAIPLYGNDAEYRGCCADCIKHPPTFHSSFSLFHYQFPINRLITYLKFHNHLEYARLLGELMCIKILKEWYRDDEIPEYVIPVPLHAQRLRERGFNQAIEIGRVITKKLHLQLDTKNCARIKMTAVQSDLAANERLSNVRNAFYVRETFIDKHVAILDDVVTTGCTVAELSRELVNQGARRVDVWSCARTNLEKRGQSATTNKN